MTLRSLTPWLLLALSVTVAGMVHGAGRNDAQITGLAATFFTASIVMASIGLNGSVWVSRDTSADLVKSAVASNVWLAAIVYAWGASALFAIYSLSDLAWRHAWQYGLGAAVFSGGILLYAQYLERKAKGPPPLFLTALHGCAILVGLGYLVASGKLVSARTDWAANQVFLAGGLAIVALCIVTAITQRRSPSPPDSPSSRQA